MSFEGPKRQGRFLKKGSKVLEKVALMEFSFQEMIDPKVISPDNSKRSIIHSHYHHPAELEENISPPSKFDDNLIPEGGERPVIMPMDFTAEWERNKRLRKDRAQRLDDEEFDFEFEASQRFSTAADETVTAGAAAGQTPASAPPGAKAPAAGDAVAPANERQRVDSANQAIKIMREGGVPAAAAGTSPAAPPSVPAAKTPSPTAAPTATPIAAPAAAAATPPAAAATIAATAATAATAAAAKAGEDFIPSGAGEQVVLDPEVEAARAYRQRLELEQQNKQQLEHLAEEAKARGYHEGFRAGEEKAEVQVRQSAGQLFGKVGELIQEFSQLKHLVLDNVQQNFYELCQAMAEALIKREFSIHPETFVAVLRRAISEAVAPGKFKVRVHPETFDRIANLDDPIKESMVKDPDVAPGDFKIESDLSVVDVNIGKMISDLLQQADLELFDKTETTEKAS